MIIAFIYGIIASIVRDVNKNFTDPTVADKE